jgi:hypothetical protein
VRRPGQALAHALKGRGGGVRLAHHVGVDPDRVDGPDVHAACGDLRPKRVGERLDAGLRRSVRAHSGPVREGRRRRGEGDVATPRLDAGERGPHGPERAEQVDLNRARERLGVDHRDRAEGRDAGVGPHHVEPAQPGDGALGRLLHRLESATSAVIACA